LNAAPIMGTALTSAAVAAATPMVSSNPTDAISVIRNSRYDVPQLMTDGRPRASSGRTTAPPTSQISHQHINVSLGLSQVFHHSDPNLTLALVTLMHKLLRVSVDETVSNESRFYVSYGNANIEWSVLSQPHSMLQIHEIRKISRQDSILYLLCGVGQGADGQAVLFRDNYGYLYVGKFSGAKEVKEAQACLAAEHQLWHDVHPELSEFVSLRNFGGRAPALIMPRFAHVRDDQHQDRDIVEAVDREIQNFADRGLVHDDLHWRHVGLY
jgi:hypothetical protein